MRIKTAALFVTLLGMITACSTVREVPAVEKGNFEVSQTPIDSVVAALPNYRDTFKTVKGKGKAIVSEPENSERVTILFSSNREKSLITIKNSIGIEGGQLLTDGDSLLVYNKVDKYARKLSVTGSDLDDINNLATVNILDILNTPVSAGEVQKMWENDETYLLQLQSGASVFVGKRNRLIQQIDQPQRSGIPYSQIKYDGYEQIEGLKLPRRITIFSADKSAKVDLLLQSLEINPEIGVLEIDLPDDIKIYRR